MGYRGLKTGFVTKEQVNMLDVLRQVVIKGYRWGWCCMSMQWVWMDYKCLGYRGLKTGLVTREEVNMLDVLRLVVTKGYSWGVVLYVHVVVMAGLQVLGLQGVGDCACDQGGQGGGGVISLL